MAHSAGAIFTAHAIPALSRLEVRWKTVQFMAPAIRLDSFKNLMMPAIKAKTCPQPSLYILSKVSELDDDVGPYGKSLLYLVSNAFENRRETPLLGMQKYLERDRHVLRFLNTPVDGLPGIVVSGVSGVMAKSTTHGGFDNDPNTMNSILIRILGAAPKRAFTDWDLHF